ELLAIATAREHRKTFGGEFLGDLGADVVAGADHRDGCVALLHWRSPGPHPEERRLRRVSKDESKIRSHGSRRRASARLLTMRCIISPRSIPRPRAAVPCRKTF